MITTKYNDETGCWELWRDDEIAEIISDITFEQAMTSKSMLKELRLRSLLACLVLPEKKIGKGWGQNG